MILEKITDNVYDCGDYAITRGVNEEGQNEWAVLTKLTKPASIVFRNYDFEKCKLFLKILLN